MLNNRVIQLLARKMAGEASDEELVELKALLESYPENLYYEEFISQIWSQRTIENEDLEAAFAKHAVKYQDDFTPTRSSQPNFKVRSIFKLFLLAASVFLFATIAIYFYKSPNRATVTPSITEIVSGKGIRKKVLLPDGTQVWLNGSSKLTFDNDMTSKAQRVVSLTGEAYFDVTKNKLRPFIINTEKFAIKVLGTAFNVKAYPGDKNAETSLIRGMIELTVNDNPSQKFILKPNEKLALAYSGQVTRQSSTPSHLPDRKLTIENIKPVQIASKDYIEETSWVDNTLVFNNESFEELKPKLERWYNVKIQISNPAVNNYHYTGAFENETITQALKALQLIRPFTFKLNKDDININ